MNHHERRNPSRKTCEDIIRRILMTEVLEKGTNEQFRNATDFMNYFESLYPASDSLTKQVQRAIRSLDLPKDDKGYFIINKTHEQLDQDQELAFMLKKTQASVVPMESYEVLFLKTDSDYKKYLLQLLHESVTFKDKYITILDTSDGLLFYTENADRLKIMLDSLIYK